MQIANELTVGITANTVLYGSGARHLPHKSAHQSDNRKAHFAMSLPRTNLSTEMRVGSGTLKQLLGHGADMPVLEEVGNEADK